MNAVLIALLVSAASGSALEANGDFQAAKGLYAELEFEAAVPKLELASGDPKLSRPERAEVLAWLGLCLFQTRKDDIARERFKQAVAFDHDVHLPDFAPPKAKALLDDVRAAAPRPPETAEPAPEPQPSAEAEAAPDEEKLAQTPPSTASASTAEGSPPSEKAGGASLLPATAIGLSVLGAAAFLGAAGAVAVAGPSAFIATDPNSFQSDAVVAQNVANGALWAAGVLGVVGAGGLAVGVPLGFISGAFLPDDDGDD